MNHGVVPLRVTILSTTYGDTNTLLPNGKQNFQLNHWRITNISTDFWKCLAFLQFFENIFSRMGLRRLHLSPY